jgi:hypothetical protein
VLSLSGTLGRACPIPICRVLHLFSMCLRASSTFADDVHNPGVSCSSIWGASNVRSMWQKVLWCCEELKLAYERNDAGGPFGVVNRPEYRALNPI